VSFVVRFPGKAAFNNNHEEHERHEAALSVPVYKFCGVFSYDAEHLNHKQKELK